MVERGVLFRVCHCSLRLCFSRCASTPQIPYYHARSKHIDVRHHYVREQVALGSVAFQYISTDQMVADILTKALPRNQHNVLMNEMGLRSSLTTSMPRLSGSVKIRNRTSTKSETIDGTSSGESSRMFSEN